MCILCIVLHFASRGLAFSFGGGNSLQQVNRFPGQTKLKGSKCNFKKFSPPCAILRNADQSIAQNPFIFSGLNVRAISFLKLDTLALLDEVNEACLKWATPMLGKSDSQSSRLCHSPFSDRADRRAFGHLIPSFK